MAIINSLLIGSGRKRVGEVCLQVVYGRTLMKKRVWHVNDARTPAQLLQRNRIKNVNLVYRVLKGISEGQLNRPNPHNSFFNEFCKRAMIHMPDFQSFPTYHPILQYCIYNDHRLPISDSSHGSLRLTFAPVTGAPEIRWDRLDYVPAVDDIIRGLILGDGSNAQWINHIVSQSDLDTGYYMPRPLAFTPTTGICAYVMRPGTDVRSSALWGDIAYYSSL